VHALASSEIGIWKGIRIWGVWPTSVIHTPPHPLDVHVDGIRARSNAAFTAVYEATADELASFAFGMVGDRRTAEDIVQQAFVELVRAAPKLKGDGRSLRAWLFRSVRFGCLDEYRRRSRHPEDPHDRLPEVPVDTDPLSHHLAPELEAALSQLSRRQRTAVLLSTVVGMSAEEIAGVLGTSRRAVYGLIERGEGRLRQLLGEGVR
jgi:RNA polymerase sigma-70 factor, ECF subfamily